MYSHTCTVALTGPVAMVCIHRGWSRTEATAPLPPGGANKHSRDQHWPRCAERCFHERFVQTGQISAKQTQTNINNVYVT